MDFAVLLPVCCLIPAALALAVAIFFVPKDRKRNIGVALAFVLGAGLLWGGHIYKALYLDEGIAGAAWEGNEAEVVRLLQLGASPEGTFDGVTALELARQGGHKNVERILIEAGAKH